MTQYLQAEDLDHNQAETAIAYRTELSWAKADAKCSRAQVGAYLLVPLVKPHGERIREYDGYNAPPINEMACLQGSCPRGRLSYADHPAGGNYNNCIGVHAEVRAILKATNDHLTLDLSKATLLVTRDPCEGCRTVIEQHNIGTVVVMGVE